MKSQKGMGHITLIISVVIIMTAVVLLVYFASTQIKDIKVKNYEADMLLVQGKIKVLGQEKTAKKDDNLIKGRKLESNEENSIIKELLEKGIISKEEEKYSEYYILDNLDLEEIGLENVKIDNGYYIVNYETYEIIYSEGVKIKGETYYKLSQIEEKTEKDENTEYSNIENTEKTETEENNQENDDENQQDEEN